MRFPGGALVCNRLRPRTVHATQAAWKAALRSTARAPKLRLLKLTQDASIPIVPKKWCDSTNKPTVEYEKTPMPLNNPFVEEPQRAHWFTKYPSDTNYRVVWLKGKKAKVPGLGSFRCPIYEFNAVAFVWMHDRTLPVDLSNHHFTTADKLPVRIQITLTAKVKNSDLALIAMATCFDDSLAVLQTDVAGIVGEFCRSRQSVSILGTEKALAAEIETQLKSAPSSSTFEVRSVLPQFRLPLLETAAEHEATSAISFEQETKKEEREAALSKLRASRTLAELTVRIEHEWKNIEAACKAEAKRADTAIEKETARLGYLQNVTALTEASKTAIFHIDPQIYRDLNLAEITNRRQHEDEAVAKIVALMKSLAEVTKNAAPVTTVVGANMPNAVKGG